MTAPRSLVGTTMILATGNPGKAKEFGRLFGGVFDVRPLPEGLGMPEETGSTFEANARLKAEWVYEALAGRQVVLADDSGLEVDHLQGRPGVFSARYAGDGATDDQNVQKLLAELRGAQDRGARFICSLCLFVPGSTTAGFVEGGDEPGGGRGGAALLPDLVVEVSGRAEGAIVSEARGEKGFGYDPVFLPLGWRETLAEAEESRKDQVSHRGAAARGLLERLVEEGWL